MKKTYLIVFHGQEVNGKIIDDGDDPCFNDPPTWGICRPTTRRSIKVEDTLIFVAKVNSRYILKGWFQVGEKIDYISALNRYPNRQNIIISTVSAQHPIRWRSKKMQELHAKTQGAVVPNFLMDLSAQEGSFYQAKNDEHEIDNWKCRRVFLCRSKQLEKCIATDACLKHGQSLVKDEYKNYVVAKPGQWEDLDNLRISLQEIVKHTGFSAPIRTPYHQHNVLRFDHCAKKFFELLSLRKS